jgi:hypothetical protein
LDEVAHLHTLDKLFLVRLAQFVWLSVLYFPAFDVRYGLRIFSLLFPHAEMDGLA